MATAEAVGTITFESDSPQLRIVRQSAIDAVSPQGAVYAAQPENVIEFAPFGTVDLAPGEDLQPDGPVVYEDGHMVLDQFNRPVRANQDAIHYLLGHPDFGVRFWVKGLKPGTALPLEADVFKAIFNAGLSLNSITLKRIREAEARTHRRPALLGACDAALERVEFERAKASDPPFEEEDEELPEWNTPDDLARRPVNAADQDAHAEAAAALASPEDPSLRGL